MLPNGLQYTRQWMNKIIGEEMVAKQCLNLLINLNALSLTNEEHALIFPAVICVKGKYFINRKYGENESVFSFQSSQKRRVV